MPNIVIINVSQQVAPTPSTRQQTGAFVSVGATTLPPGTRRLLTSSADLATILTGAAAITSITWTTGVATVTTSAPHGLEVGDQIFITISGALPIVYNQSRLATITGASTFTYGLATNPGGAATTPGLWTLADVAELVQMNTTFFAQGNNQSVYVLELGVGSSPDGIAALGVYLVNNPDFFYSYLTPREWASEPSFPTLMQSYQAPDKKTYFFQTVTQATYSNFAGKKCAVTLIESPDITSAEFSLAAVFYVTLHYAPSATNKVTVLSQSYVYGVTPYPTPGNATLLATLKAAGVNVISTGAEGGISNTTIVWGQTMDVRPFNYWYNSDWVQIQQDQAIANAVINGSNNPINPLYYNQPGIDRLQAVAAGVMDRGVTFGVVLFPSVQTELDGPELGRAIDQGLYVGRTIVNAIPFIPYSAENPGDYKIGRYAGLSSVFVPQLGFDTIVFNLVISDFVAS